MTYSPLAMPLNDYVVDDRIEARCDPVRLIFGEYNCAPMAAFMEGFENVWDIILLVAISLDCADIRTGFVDRCICS